ncbi:MAG: hypothetical protein ABEN55_07540, partial [Bradymonadaceae bacterium]
KTSFQTNPPLEANADVDNLSKKLEELRKKARGHKKKAEKLQGKARKQKLQTALESISEAIRLQGSEVAEGDKTLQRELQQTDPMQSYRGDLTMGVYKNLKSGSIADARIQYQNLRAVDSTATAGPFFGTVNSAKVQRIDPKGQTSSDEEAGDDQ